MKNIFSDISQSQAVKYLRIMYPIWFVVGLFGIMYVPSTLIVPGDAATTASNIMGNELLFRMGIVGSLVTQLIHILVVLVLYQLFKSVNKDHSLLLVVFGLVGVPISMLNTLNRVAALLLARGADYLTALEPFQLNALMMFFLNLNEQGILIATIFWGLWLFPLGYLIYLSGYFPKIVGIVVMLAGLGYTLEPFISLLLPAYAATIIPILYILVMGELVFMAWIVVKGAKLP
ncbi:MAG: DUF4386 domain-containing protein [Promethearchaeota archaeon]|jgi:hypothetical protein